MKNYIVLLFLFCSYASYSQSVKSSEINNTESIKLLGSVESFELFSGRQLSMGIFKVSNGSGSANFPGSHEISHNLLMSVAHYDENPDFKLFSIGPFIGPKVIRKLDSGQLVTLFIEHGVIDSRKTTKVVVGETNIQIQ